MKVITIPTQATALITLLEQARQENLILRTSDGTEFILAELDDFDREIALTRQNAELMRLLDQHAQQSQAIGLTEVKDLLGLN